MEQQPIRQLNVERSFEETLAPNPTDILIAAEAEDAKPIYVSASDYATAVHALRTKGFTWREVQEWLAARNVNFSEPAIIAGYRGKYQQEDRSLPDVDIGLRPLVHSTWSPKHGWQQTNKDDEN